MTRADRILPFLPWLAWLIASLPILLHGLPAGHDWAMEVTRVAEYRHALFAGQFPPFWAENLYGGYGSPAFLFYAPLFCGIAAVLSLTGSFLGGTAIAAVAVLLVGLLTSRWLGQALVGDGSPAPSDNAGRVLAVLFILSPYLVCNGQLRNAYAELTALCLLPLPLVGILRLKTAASRREVQKAVAIAALGLALVILAHNLTALLAMVFVLTLGAALVPPRRWPFGLGAIALALTATSFFWVPALRLQGLVRLDDLQTGKFDYHVQFKSLVSSFGWQAFYGVGVLPLLLVAAAVPLLRHRNRAAAVFLAAAFCAVLFQLRLSIPLWENLPFLPLFQFPWRFMGPLTLAAAALGALAFAHLPISARWRGAAEILLFATALANVTPHLLDVRAVDSEVREAFEASLDADMLRRSASHRVTVLDEYLPRGADGRLWHRLPAVAGPVAGVRGPASYNVVLDESRQIQLQVQAEAAASLRLARWDFPGWSASIDGQEVPLRGNNAGLIDVDVPAGDSLVTLRQQAPWERRLLLWPSAVAWIFILGLFRGHSRHLQGANSAP